MDIGGGPKRAGDPAVPAADFKYTLSVTKVQRFQYEFPVAVGFVLPVVIGGFAPALPKIGCPLERVLIRRFQIFLRESRVGKILHTFAGIQSSL